MSAVERRPVRRVRKEPRTPIEIAPHVFEIPLPRVKVHVVVEESLTLIDAGLTSSVPAIDRAITSLGRSPRDVRRVVCTHGHFDHAGGAAELGRRDDVELLIHEADLARLPITLSQAARRPGRRLFIALTPVPDRATPLHDGDVLPVLGGLRVVHVPGHTPGSICLYAEQHRLLFVGDALQARFGRVGYASRLYSDDWRAARAAVQRLAALDVETIVFSHFPPLRNGATAILARLADDAVRAEGKR